VLEPLGVRDVDERLYRILLTHQHSTTDDLARAVGLGRSTVATGLDRLEELGLVRRAATRPVRYSPTPPDTAIEQLIRRRHGQLDQLRQDTNALVADFYAATIKREPQGLIEIVAGGDAVLRQARALEKTTTSEILSFDKPPFLVETLADHDEVGNESPILDRGVAVRAIYTTDALAETDRFARVSKLVRLGEHARVLPELPLKLRIFDRQTALVPLAVDVGVMHSVAVVRRSALLEALVALFELLWERAAPFASTEPLPEPTPLATEDQHVISMLAAGLSDQAMARNLGISARTVRRRIQRVLDLLDTSTLFQAGAASVRERHIP